MEAWREQTRERRAAMAVVKAAMKKTRWTQTGLAKELGQPPMRLTVPLPTLNYWLNGYTRIPESTLWAICKIVGGVEVADVTAAIADEAMLIQPKRKPHK